MEFNSEELSYEQAVRVSDFYRSLVHNSRDFLTKHSILQDCGLDSISENKYFFCSSTKKSYLHVKDSHKYMLAKIKYGF